MHHVKDSNWWSPQVEYMTSHCLNYHSKNQQSQKDHQLIYPEWYTLQFKWIYSSICFWCCEMQAVKTTITKQSNHGLQLYQINWVLWEFIFCLLSTPIQNCCLKYLLTSQNAIHASSEKIQDVCTWYFLCTIVTSGWCSLMSGTSISNWTASHCKHKEAIIITKRDVRHCFLMKVCGLFLCLKNIWSRRITHCRAYILCKTSCQVSFWQSSSY